MPNPVPNRRAPIYFNQERVDAFLSTLTNGQCSSSWYQEQERYLRFWRKRLNSPPRASLRDDQLAWRFYAILRDEKAQASKLAVLRSFVNFLVVRGDLRADEDHLHGLPNEFFRAPPRNTSIRVTG